MKREIPKSKLTKKLFSWRSKQGEAYKTYVKTSAVGLEFGLSIGLGALLGYFIDKYFNTLPIGLLMGSVIGTIAGVKRLVIFTKNYLREQEKKSNHDKKSQ